MTITKLTEIAVKFTISQFSALLSSLQSLPQLQQLLVISSGLHVCLKKLLFQDALKRLGHKNVIHGCSCLKGKTSQYLHK